MDYFALLGKSCESFPVQTAQPSKLRSPKVFRVVANQFFSEVIILGRTNGWENQIFTTSSWECKIILALF
jgi:hypothetical protein